MYAPFWVRPQHERALVSETLHPPVVDNSSSGEATSSHVRSRRAKTSRGLSRLDQAKPEIRRSTADFGVSAATNQIPRAVLRGAQIRSAAHDALSGSSLLRVIAVARTLRVFREWTRLRQHGVIIRPVPIG